jgi:ABC-type amino acid transport substrate-binding protein
VAVIRGTTTEDHLRYYNMEMVPADSFSEMLRLLKNDQIDAVIYDAPPLLYAAKR